MNTTYIIYAVIAVGIFTAYMALVHIFRRDRLRERLEAAAGPGYALADEERTPPLLAMFCENVLSIFGTDVRAQKDLSRQLLAAGITSTHAVSYFLFFKRLIQPILLVLGAIVFVRVIISADLPGLDKLFNLLVAVMLMTIGLFGANLYVTNCKKRRQAALLYSFPEALDLLLVCIESGLGLDAALSRVASETRRSHPEVAYELERTRIELTVKGDRVEALQNLADRTEIVPFKSLVAALIQTEKFGTSLVDTLRVLSEDQRVSRLLAVEARASRLPVLITIPLILCILPAFIMIILGPAVVKVKAQGGIFGGAEQNTGKRP